jgi:prefoldin alpha subunit
VGLSEQSERMSHFGSNDRNHWGQDPWIREFTVEVRNMTKKTKDNQKQLQEKYFEYQMLEEQTKQVQEQLQTVAKQIDELENIKLAVQHIDKTQTGTEILVPVSSGIFLKTALKENSELLVNVGDNVVVPKTMAEAVALIKKQQKDIETFQENLAKNMQVLLMHQQRVEAELMALAQEE